MEYDPRLESSDEQGRRIRGKRAGVPGGGYVDITTDTELEKLSKQFDEFLRSGGTRMIII